MKHTFQIFPDGRAAGSAPVSGSDLVTKNYLTESIISGTAGIIESVVVNGTASIVTNKTASVSVDVPAGLPAVTSVDDGKILVVVSGSWTMLPSLVVHSGWSAPDSALGSNGDIYLQLSQSL